MASKKRSSSVKRRVRLKLHLRFKTKIVLDCIILALLLCILTISLYNDFSKVKNDVVTYKENSNIDYKVYLKDNNFYETPYLEKGMAYVASLIDNIKIKYNYKFETNVESNLDVQYRVVAKLVIASQNNSNIFYEKEYELTKTVIDEMVDEKDYVIDRDVEIDYQYYNNLANQFRANYAVNATSYLDVYLQTIEVNKENNSYKLSNDSKTSLIIPLSEQEINIKLDNKNVDETKQISNEDKIIVKDLSHIILYVILTILIIVVLILLIKKIYLFNNKNMSEYDKHIRKLLIGYDRIIINVKSVPHRKDYNIIEVEDFQELVDARDNTKEPINYHVIKEHEKCEFFVINDNNLYLYEIKESMFNKDE